MALQGTLDAIDEFTSEGLVRDVVATLKSGKEATAYLCEIDAGLGAGLGVAKVYHDRKRRDFSNDGAYEVGKRLLEAVAPREARAVANRSSTGRALQGAMWVDHEFELLSDLHYAGVDVPEPYASTERAILMEYVGQELQPAPQLNSIRLDRYEAERLLVRMLWNVETMLANHVIHADLSPYNVLFHRAALRIIDLPQAVDARFHPRAQGFLERDVRNMAAYFRRAGVEFDDAGWVAETWDRYSRGEL